LQAAQVIDGRIDVSAQRWLLRLAADPSASVLAQEILAAVKAQRLAGIYGDDLRAAADMARRLGTVRWRLVPQGQDAAVVLDPRPSGQQAAIVFREHLRTLPLRLDEALRQAWATFQLLLAGALQRCPPNGAARAARSPSLVVGNLVPPGYCMRPAKTTTETILLSGAVADGSFTSDCTFEVAINGAPVSAVRGRAGGAVIPLPTSPRPLRLALTVRSTVRTRWDAEGTFELRGDGRLVVVDAPSFRQPQPVNLPGQGPAISVVGILSQVRDVTSRVLRELAAVPPDRRRGHHPATWPPTAWDTPALIGHNYIASPPVAGGNLAFDRTDVDPDTDDLVVEVAGVPAPQLIAVSCPRAVVRDAGSGPTPFLVYLHPNVGQNVGAGFYQGPYPFSWDYLFYGLWRYMNYLGDPLTIDPYAKGLPYQMSRSGKSAVIVLPCNRVGAEIGVFQDAGSVETILREIQALLFRRRGVFTAPPLGRTAMASFSAGNGLVTQFLTNSRNRSHSFYLDTLREVYMFEAPQGLVPQWVTQALRWANAGSTQGKRVRAYTRGSSDAYRRLVAGSLPRPPFVAESPSGFHSAAALPDAAWRRAGAVVRSWQEPHQLVSAMLLTDALRRSGF
jgi:hypothetical protein